MMTASTILGMILSTILGQMTQVLMIQAQTIQAAMTPVSMIRVQTTPASTTLLAMEPMIRLEMIQLMLDPSTIVVTDLEI